MTLSTLTFARVAPFAVFIGCMIFESAAKSLAPSLFKDYQAYFYPLRVLLTTFTLIYFWRNYAEFRPIYKGLSAADWGFAVLVGFLVIAFWIVVGPYARIGAAPTGENPVPVGQWASIFWLISRFVGTAILIPIIEELFWRSYLMRRLDSSDVDTVNPRSVSWLAILASSAVFAMEHKELLAGFVAGLAFAWCYMRKGNLREAIVAHSVANALLFAYVITFKEFHFWN